MMHMHPKYNIMHKNGVIYALKCYNNYVILSISCMLPIIYPEDVFGILGLNIIYTWYPHEYHLYGFLILAHDPRC